MKIVTKCVKECLKCHRTNKEIELYFCRRHKKAFCKQCLTGGKRALRFDEAEHCNNIYFLGEFFNAKNFNEMEHNCIYEMIPVLEEEAAV
jgi:hypothetical protein